eukprot:RCo004062
MVTDAHLGRVRRFEEAQPTLSLIDAERQGFDTAAPVVGKLTDADEFAVFDPQRLFPVYAVLVKVVTRPQLVDVPDEDASSGAVIRQSRERAPRPEVVSLLTGNVRLIEEPLRLFTVEEYLQRVRLLDHMEDLGHYCRDDQKHPLLQNNDLWRVMLRLAQTPSEVVQWFALRAIGNYCYENKENGTRIRDLGIYPILFGMLPARALASELVLQKTLFVLTNVSFSVRPQEESGFSPFQTWLGEIDMNAYDQVTFFLLLCVLRNVVFQEPAFAARVVELRGFVMRAVRLLATVAGSSERVGQAVSSIAVLTFNYTNRPLLQRFEEAGLLREFGRILRRFHTYSREAAKEICCATWSLSGPSSHADWEEIWSTASDWGPNPWPVWDNAVFHPLMVQTATLHQESTCGKKLSPSSFAAFVGFAVQHKEQLAPLTRWYVGQLVNIYDCANIPPASIALMREWAAKKPSGSEAKAAPIALEDI